MARRKRPGYYVVAGLDLGEEMDRLRALPLFRGGKLERRRPELRIRRPAKQPNRVGFAVLREWRISVTAYPGVRLGDAQEILLHELCHLHVGELPGRRRWHGKGFRDTLHVAMAQAYGLRISRPRSIHHGVYAEAIERNRGPEQLELGLAA
ncbi:MAG: SprT-like domain-containing protein [Solirubrobacterales bacterium]